MRVSSLLYHDVVKKGEFDVRRFAGCPEAAKYSIDYDEFERHIWAIRSALRSQPRLVLDILSSTQAEAFLLTFDDGRVSAYRYVADILDRYGWKAHFFVTTDHIGHPAVLSPGQIRELRKLGHAIGSHSSSHPHHMSVLEPDELAKEWTSSVAALSDILGEPVTIASIPGGSYSKKVAEAAARSGITALFTSEPVVRTHCVETCTVFGRYTVLRGMAPKRSAEFASGRGWSRLRQFTFWNAKKAVKTACLHSKLLSRLLQYSTLRPA